MVAECHVVLLLAHVVPLPARCIVPGCLANPSLLSLLSPFVQIVYVAPMKALAAEVTANFGKRLAPLGLVVKELTGRHAVLFVAEPSNTPRHLSPVHTALCMWHNSDGSCCRVVCGYTFSCWYSFSY